MLFGFFFYWEFFREKKILLKLQDESFLKKMINILIK